MKSVRTAGLACAAILGVLLLGCAGSAPSNAPRRIAVCDTIDGPAEQASLCPEPTCNPRITHWAQPASPPEAEAQNQRGKAIVKVLVLPSGTAGSVQLLQSTGFDLLDEAALTAARDCRFEPGCQRGIPVRSWMALPFEFPPEDAD